MIGPHYQKLAQIQNKFNTRQLLQRIQTKSSNPLTQIIDKLKRQFSQYQTAYDDQLIDHQITSVDRLLSFDGKLGPILSGLQKQNNILRRQLSVMETQLSNTVSICEQIIAQNGQLKQIIKNKNLDIQKIIQTIAMNQSQARNQLQNKLELMQQENSILIRHLDEVKKQHQTYSDQFINKDKQIQAWKRKCEEIKLHLTEVSDHQKQLSRKLSLTQHNLYAQKQKNYELQQLNQNLVFQNNEMKNQLLIYQDQNKNFNIQALQQKMQEQYSGIIEEHKQLKKQRSQILRQLQTKRLQCEKIQNAYNDVERKANKCYGDLQLTSSLFNEQKQKNSILQSNMARLQQKIDDLKQQNNKYRLECESTNSYAINKQKILQRQIEQLRSELDKKSIQMETRLKDIRQKTRSLMQAKEGQLKSLNDTNIQLRRILQRQNEKI